MNENKTDMYSLITDKIITQLEDGIIPWKKPWNGARLGAYNRITKKPYSLLNQMLLSNTGEYATYKQWKSLGGQVRKGEKSEIVAFWKSYPLEEEKITPKGIEKTIKTIPVLRYYNVFHISQVDGVEPLPIVEANDLNPLEEAEKIIKNYSSKDNLKLQRDSLSNEAYYSPLQDLVNMPALEQFNCIEEYYSTFFHELTHSTKHEKRLNRDNKELSHFGSDNYSKEELVAEIGASNMLNILGISTEKAFKNSVAYIQSWLSVLKNDKKFIVSASSKAQKATKYILSFTEEYNEEEASEE